MKDWDSCESARECVALQESAYRAGYVAAERDLQKRPPEALLDLLGEVAAERRCQKTHWPDCERLPDGTGGGGRVTWMAQARNACDRAHREGTITHAHVFDEEASEVLAETDAVKLRKELLQVMAVCAKWIADIDSREA